MTKHELFQQIEENFLTLQQNHFGKTKASQARARKAAGEIKKLITPYKKASVEETKQGLFTVPTSASGQYYYTAGRKE